jgi:hypothetical protein
MAMAPNENVADANVADVAMALPYGSVAPSGSDEAYDAPSGSDNEAFNAPSGSDEGFNAPSGSDNEVDEQMANDRMPDEDDGEDAGGLPAHFLQPIYPGARHAYGTFAVTVQTFADNHHLTRSARQDLLDLLTTLLPEGSYFPSTCYKLDKVFGRPLRTPSFSFCLACSSRIENIAPTCVECGALLRDNTGRFWTFDAATQLRCFMEDCKLLRLVTYPIDQVACANQLRQATSLSYERLKQRIPLQQRCDLSYTMGIDAFPLHSTSSEEICPIYLSINELPEHLKPDFIVVCGIWIAKKEAKSAAFMPTLIPILNALQTAGVTVRHQDGAPFGRTLRFHPLLAIMDAPQRAEALSLTRFNGTYGCDKCYLRARSIQRRNGYARVFNSADEQLSVQAAATEGCQQPDVRCLADTRMLAATKEPNAVHKLGVKAVSPLDELVGFDYICYSTTCYLHQVCLGQVRWLMLQLFAPANKKPLHPSAIPDLRQQLTAIDTAVLTLKIPASINRPPRSLREVLHFRGHEHESWLLVYAPFVLQAFLPPDYYRHLLVLSSAIFWLTLDGVDSAVVMQCNNSLHAFGELLGNLYTQTALTYNAHQTSKHLVQTALIAGPLRSSSAGLFEANHFRLRSLIHGKRNADVELCNILCRRIACKKITARLRRSNIEIPRRIVQPSRVIDGNKLQYELTDGTYQSANLANGVFIEVFNEQLVAKRVVSCFVGCVAGDTVSFGRVDSIYLSGGRVCVSIQPIPVEIRARHPLEELNGNATGCPLRHFCRLLADPFGDLPPLVADYANRIVGTCVVNRHYIALLPCNQGWHAP